MPRIIISSEKRTQLLTAAASGGRFETMWFQFTHSDSDFQAELVRTAENAKNTAFFESLREFIAEQRKKWQFSVRAAKQQSRKAAAQRKTARRQEENARGQAAADLNRNRQVSADRRRQQQRQHLPNLKITPSPKNNSPGISFVEYLNQNGLYFLPKYTYRPPFIRFVSGGAVDSNRRRH